MPARISDEKLDTIICLKKEGIPIVKIASITGVHRMTIHRYLHSLKHPKPISSQPKKQTRTKLSDREE